MALLLDPSVTLYMAQASDLTRQVFSRIAEQSAVSGWAVCKMLNRNSDEIEPILADLRRQQLLNSDEPGLDGTYYLTQLGYIARSILI